MIFWNKTLPEKRQDYKKLLVYKIMEPYSKTLSLRYAIKYGSKTNQPHELQRLARLEILIVASIGIILSRHLTTMTLIRLSACV